MISKKNVTLAFIEEMKCHLSPEIHPSSTTIMNFTVSWSFYYIFVSDKF